MKQLSTLRINLLRGMYAIMFVGLAIQIWPGIVNHPADLELMRTAVRSLLAGLSLVAALGIRYPVRMLPVLLFELTWKLVWVLAFGVPLWLGHRMDADAAETMKACLMGVVLCPLVIPWGYVWEHYVKAPGDRWRTPARGAAGVSANANG